MSLSIYNTYIFLSWVIPKNGKQTAKSVCRFPGLALSVGILHISVPAVLRILVQRCTGSARTLCRQTIIASIVVLVSMSTTSTAGTNHIGVVEQHHLSGGFFINCFCWSYNLLSSIRAHART